MEVDVTTPMSYLGSGDKLPEKFNIGDIYIMGKNVYVATETKWEVLGQCAFSEPSQPTIYIKDNILVFDYL